MISIEQMIEMGFIDAESGQISEMAKVFMQAVEDKAFEDCHVGYNFNIGIYRLGKRMIDGEEKIFIEPLSIQ